MKIVLNTCFGGFGLSEEGMNRFNELSGLNLVKDNDPMYPNSTFWKIKDGNNFFDFNIERNDPNLIKVVEELGENSFGAWAQLEVVEIPDDIPWEIDSYDGSENIMSNGKPLIIWDED